jgi:acyl-coenzyme A thioesterase PaaI-like protein
MDNVNVRTAMKLNLVRPVFEKTGKIQRYGEVITLGRRVATAEARIIDQERRLYGRDHDVFDLPSRW